ncbi:MAG: O-antigen ligase family protein [Rhabdochlamydiaceae bacterium]|nr:O-antigen ligase family protein [Rhabdochlamydiaceae bacterium]
MAVLSSAGVLKRSFALTVFFTLLFFYLLFSSGEQLHLVLGIYKPKIGHILALVLFGWVMLQKLVWKLERRMLIAFAFILASLVLSAVFGAAPLRSFGYVGVYLFNFLVYFFLPLQIVMNTDLDRFFRIYWGSFLVVGSYAALQVALSIVGVYDPLALQRVIMIARGQAWTYEPSYYALYMIPYVMFHNGAALLREYKRPMSRIKLFCQNMLMLISTSTGLIVSYPVFLVSILFKRLNPFQKEVRQKFTKMLTTSFILLAVFTVLFYEIALHSIFKFFYFGFLAHWSFSARWEGIVAACKTFIRHPILGAGLGGVSTEGFREESVYDLKMETLQEFEAFDPTNCFTEVLASLGIVGLLAFIYLGYVFYRSFQEVMKDLSIDLESKKIATALFLSLVVMIVALQMNQGLFRPYVWIHAAVVYGYFQRIRTFS